MAVAGSARSLPADFLGVNGEALTAPRGLWSSPRLRAAIAVLAPEALRFFGGTTANWWDWRAGTFVRTPGVPPVLARARTRVSVTLHDWAALARAAGADPVYDLNVVSAGLGDQLAMLRAAHALGLPVRRVELGNELYLPRYRSLFATGADYGRMASVWISALKSAFPGVRVAVSAALPGVAGAGRPGDRERGWNAALLAVVRGEDALAFHPYFASGLTVGDSLTSATAAGTLLSAPDRGLDALRRIGLDALPSGTAAWVTEFNLYDRRAAVYGTWGQGLALAEFVLGLLGDPRVEQADQHALVYSAPFAALFSDRAGLDFGPVIGRRAGVARTASGFRSPARAAATTPWSLSASGTAVALLLDALHGHALASPLAFVAPGGGPSAAAGGVRGELLPGGRAAAGVLVNLGAGRIVVSLPPALRGSRLVSVSAPPGTVVTGRSSLRASAARAGAAVSLSPHSLTVLGGDLQRSPR